MFMTIYLLYNGNYLHSELERDHINLQKDYIKKSLSALCSNVSNYLIVVCLAEQY